MRKPHALLPGSGRGIRRFFSGRRAWRAGLLMAGATAWLSGPALSAEVSRQAAPPRVAAGAKAPAEAATQPPIIDRELFFGDPEVSGAQISPNGRYLAFVKPFKATRNVWVKGIAEPFAAARPITADFKRPITSYFWSRDSRFILFAQDQAGDENFNVYAVDPAAKPAAGSQVPEARNLTGMKGVRTFIYEVPKSDPDVIFVGLNDRDKAWHDLYKVTLSTGERTLVRKNSDRITGWVFDLKGNLRLATRAAENGDTEVLRVDPGGFTKVYSCSVFEDCGPLRYNKDGKRIFMQTNKGDAVDLVRLILFDPESLKEDVVESDPLKRVDLGSAVFSEVTDDLLVTVYADDKARLYFKDKSLEADYQLLRQKLPGKEIGFGSSTTDEKIWLITASSDTEPGERYLFDRTTKRLTLQYRVFEKLVRANLATMRAVRYASSDGLQIPAYVTLPKGVPGKNLPAVIIPHGGPWARDNWGYDPFAQFLANRGYAVLQPNFRGSTGYGKKFLNAGNKQWGDKMQDDITWGAKYLADQGLADPKRIGIMGGSYGGYATLAGVAFTPDTYGAAVSIVGPSNLITLLDSIPPYWEAGRKVFSERMGDPSTPEGKAQLERQSPLNAASRIKTPLMVVQGANDPRVNKAESDQIVIALRDRGFPVEYIVAPDEGHGFARPVNNMAMFAAAEKFLAARLGGRFQVSMTPEVEKRLGEITVDPKTVERPRRVVAAATAPAVATGLQPGTSSYKTRIDLGGQGIDLTTTSEIKADQDSWIVTETAATPMGDMLDRAVLAKDTLVLRKRSTSQGPVSIEFDVRDNRATGTMKLPGQDRNISVALDGPLFADGAGAYFVIAALPLAEGYTTSFRNLDVQTQKVAVVELKVAGGEQMSVPAGVFDCFKVEMTSLGDGARTTVWVAKKERKPVKIVAILPSMNGATMTSELQK
jgi:dipeptidyl aminopeptidase/acylaminoacyl peptidase